MVTDGDKILLVECEDGCGVGNCHDDFSLSTDFGSLRRKLPVLTILQKTSEVSWVKKNAPNVGAFGFPSYDELFSSCSPDKHQRPVTG